MSEKEATPDMKISYFFCCFWQWHSRIEVLTSFSLFVTKRHNTVNTFRWIFVYSAMAASFLVMLRMGRYTGNASCRNDTTADMHFGWKTIFDQNLENFVEIESRKKRKKEGGGLNQFFFAKRKSQYSLLSTECLFCYCYYLSIDGIKR